MARLRAMDRRNYILAVRLNVRERKYLDRLKEQTRLRSAELVRVLLCNVRPEDARSFVGR